jgi:hypothetical protein
VKTIFYKDPDESVFAYFPEEDYDKVEQFKACYAHVGQHSACHPKYLKQCKPATKEEAAPLLKELRSIGYDPDIQNNWD